MFFFMFHGTGVPSNKMLEAYPKRVGVTRHIGDAPVSKKALKGCVFQTYGIVDVFL